MYNFEEIVGKTIIDMHATTVKTELYRKAGEQIDEHTFYVDVEFIAFQSRMFRLYILLRIMFISIGWDYLDRVCRFRRCKKT